MIWKRFYTNAVKYGWDDPDKKIVVSVSGGPDSVVLLDLLARLKKCGGPELHVFHLNHKLRGGEAEEDAAFVQRLAEQYQIKYSIMRFNVALFSKQHKLSLEEAGRRIRYHFLRRVAKRYNCRWIATGHTRDDQVETFFMHLFRGSGPGGLAGIQSIREETIIRPILEFTRDEIMKYCNENSLTYRVDSSNECVELFRNKIRHELIPYIEEYFEHDIKNTIIKTIDIIKEEDIYMEEAAKIEYDKIAVSAFNGIRFIVPGLIKLQVAMQRRLIRMATCQVLGGMYDISFSHIEAIRKLLNGRNGTQWKLEKRLIVEYAHGFLSFWKDSSLLNNKRYIVNIPGTIFLPQLGSCLKTKVYDVAPGSLPWVDIVPPKNKHGIIYLDYNIIEKELFARSRLPGDKIKLACINGTKKVSDILIDKKIPRSTRNDIVILETNNIVACIIGVNPYVVAKDAMITNKTVKILEIKIDNQGEK